MAMVIVHPALINPFRVNQMARQTGLKPVTSHTGRTLLVGSNAERDLVRARAWAHSASNQSHDPHGPSAA